jgi:hypothetical protein
VHCSIISKCSCRAAGIFFTSFCHCGRGGNKKWPHSVPCAVPYKWCIEIFYWLINYTNDKCQCTQSVIAESDLGIPNIDIAKRCQHTPLICDVLVRLGEPEHWLHQKMPMYSTICDVQVRLGEPKHRLHWKMPMYTTICDVWVRLGMPKYRLHWKMPINTTICDSWDRLRDPKHQHHQNMTEVTGRRESKIRTKQR